MVVERDTWIFQTNRLSYIIHKRAPDKEIKFDEIRTAIHFRIYDRATGSEIVPEVGVWLPSELAEKSDTELWNMLKQFSHGRLGPLV
jgi:hypothetical protein